MKHELEDLDEDKFNRFIAEKSISVIDLWAPWCIPCKQIEEELKELLLKYRDVGFGKVDVSKDPNIAVRYRVMSVPAILIFYKGSLKARIVGNVSIYKVEEEIRKLYNIKNSRE